MTQRWPDQPIGGSPRRFVAWPGDKGLRRLWRIWSEWREWRRYLVEMERGKRRLAMRARINL